MPRKSNQPKPWSRTAKPEQKPRQPTIAELRGEAKRVFGKDATVAADLYWLSGAFCAGGSNMFFAREWTDAERGAAPHASLSSSPAHRGVPRWQVMKAFESVLEGN